MGRDYTDLKLDCGCIETTSEHDFFIQIETYISSRCEKHQIEENERKKRYEEEWNKKKEEIKMRMYDFIKSTDELEEKLVPIKYLENISNHKENDEYLLKNTYKSFDSFNKKLLLIQKIRGRYYCCKNRVDKYIENKLFRFFFIRYSPYGKDA